MHFPWENAYICTMKKSALTLCLCLCTTVLFSQDKLSRSEYIEKYKEIAIEQMIQTGIPASITMAQACLESANGNSTLAREANNHFGIKCHGWQGGGYYQDDDEKNECFRKYNTPEESFQDHSDFLRYRDRYASLFSLEPTDYKGWAFGLKRAGYATATDYAQRLIRIIEENNLAKLDTLKEEVVLPPTPVEAEVSIVLKPESAPRLYNLYLNREIHQQNGVAYVIANGYDTYASIASDYRLFKKEILRFNDLQYDRPIPAGTRIYIEKKKKGSARHLDKHVVEEGDTMYDLSQRYAVAVKYLYKYNNLKAGQEPEPGSILKLRK